ncbi:MAG: molybdate ABC transporter permease subunit [Planctomycetes bacterium]|nr:molybdate ABC transporter permease subunit [Planctomycetota bacterium]
MDAALLVPLALSVQVAAAATALGLPPAVALGWVLARDRLPGRALLQTLVALPLVLPPTAVGYLLLRLLGRKGLLGTESLGVDLDLLFTWKGAVLASAVMALPLMVQAARGAFEEVDPRLESMARTLGHGPLSVALRFTVPLARRGLAAAALLGFGRALGEFGATVIVAGNIEGRTQTLALAIFNDIQVGDEARASQALGLTLVLAFLVLLPVERLLRRRGAP